MVRGRLCKELRSGALAVGEQNVVDAAEPYASVPLNGRALLDDLVAKVLRAKDGIEQHL